MMDLVALAQENGWSGPGPWWPIFPVLWFLVVIAVIERLAVLKENR